MKTNKPVPATLPIPSSGEEDRTEGATPAHLRRVGTNLRGLLNDLKRDAATAARELGITPKEMDAYLSGARAIPAAVVAKAVRIWPVNERDFYLMYDDAPDGARGMSARDSERSSRVLQRKGKDYYEYRDTAMSRLAMFRPEWIRELCVVDDNDPGNADVQWNNGHFMHQFTYFIGPVNFYYVEDGRKRVAIMNTGDSMYITPFVPHTFATRANGEGEDGLILAVTCGHKIMGDAQHELSAVGRPWAAEYALDFSTPQRAFGELLHLQRTNATIDEAALALLTGLSQESLAHYERGQSMPPVDVVTKIAAALKVQTRDLLPPDRIAPRVVVQEYGAARRWPFPTGAPAYDVAELATTPMLPHARPFELTLKETARERVPDLRVGLHQYCYNVSRSPVTFLWDRDGQIRERRLEPDDSLYVKPFVEHAFRATDGRPAKVLVIRIGGRMAGEPTRELSVLGKTDAGRVIEETVQWYNPEGRN